LRIAEGIPDLVPILPPYSLYGELWPMGAVTTRLARGVAPV
jgi:hypothetical protein